MKSEFYYERSQSYGKGSQRMVSHIYFQLQKPTLLIIPVSALNRGLVSEKIIRLLQRQC